MPAVLCFGDSNTWGCSPVDGSRFAPKVRWPGVASDALGPDYDLIEEGLGGRTTVFDLPPSPWRSGSDLLEPVMETHAPLDLVVLLLGTNDVALPGVTMDEIAAGAFELISIIQRSIEAGPGLTEAPAVLLVAPPVVGPILPEELVDYGDAVALSKGLGEAYATVAKHRGVAFLDLAPHVTTSPVDGWHWDPEQHANAGTAIAAAIKDITRA